jgi:hypothetical protein
MSGTPRLLDVSASLSHASAPVDLGTSNPNPLHSARNDLKGEITEVLLGTVAKVHCDSSSRATTRSAMGSWSDSFRSRKSPLVCC